MNMIRKYLILFLSGLNVMRINSVIIVGAFSCISAKTQLFETTFSNLDLWNAKILPACKTLEILFQMNFRIPISLFFIGYSAEGICR